MIRRNTTSVSYRGSISSWELEGAGCSNQMQVAQGQVPCASCNPNLRTQSLLLVNQLCHNLVFLHISKWKWNRSSFRFKLSLLVTAIISLLKNVLKLCGCTILFVHVPCGSEGWDIHRHVYDGQSLRMLIGMCIFCWENYQMEKHLHYCTLLTLSH